MTRNRYFSLLAALVLTALFAQGKGKRDANPKNFFVYFGTYTRQDSKGIYAYRFQSATGKLTPIGLVGESENPSFVAIHPNGKYLYASNELSNYQGERSGSVSAFSIDAKTGMLTLLNRVSAKGGTTAHLAVDHTGKCLLVANYGVDAGVATFAIKDDGSLGEASTVLRHSGSSTGPRQTGPHPHSVYLSPDNRFVFVPDLGTDQVFSYRLDAAMYRITPNTPPFAAITRGSGPRHFAFHPNAKFTYTLSEMGSLVTVSSYDRSTGTMKKELQTISTLPTGFNGENNTAEIFAHPSGKFLYVSNRGHDSIAVFAIDSTKGTLTIVEQASTRGAMPRGFAIDPTGMFLLAANQNTNNTILFRIGQKTGSLTPTGDELHIPAPVCVVFAPSE